ncbi:MAG: hypothetical protein AAFY88_00580, partial [Acidobacteriota bacterium]
HHLELAMDTTKNKPEVTKDVETDDFFETTSGTGTIGAPSAVVFNSQLHVYFVNGSSIRSRRTTNGQTWVDGDFILEAAHDGVGVAVFNNTVYMVLSRDLETTVPGSPDRNRLFYKVRNASGSWGGSITIRGAKTDVRPALVATDTHLVTLYKGVNTNNIYYATSTNGTTWAGNRVASGKTEDGGPALVYLD